MLVLPTPTISFDKEPYIIDGVKWYPYRTRMTITFAQDMTNLTGYIKDKTGEETDTRFTWNDWSRQGSSTTYETTLYETMTYEAKIIDAAGQESEILKEEIHIMADESGVQNNYKVIGKRYPALVTGHTGYTTYGTDIYWTNNSLKSAAIHVGQIAYNETKLLMIEIVEYPEGGYIGSTRNGVTSQNYSSGATENNYYYGYVFIDANGERIKAPTIESVSQVPYEKEITVAVEGKAYNGASISKYYYKIDNEEYIESDSSTYTFTNIIPYRKYTINVYAVDTNGTKGLPKTIYSFITGDVRLSTYEVKSNGDYAFYNEGDTLIPSNTGIDYSVANSYIEIDLTQYSKNNQYTISLEAEVSSESPDYGYATITTETTAPAYSNASGRFICISGTVENKEYTTTVSGGQKYYLHLGYRKDQSIHKGDDRVIFKNLNIR